jgi:hypothetical protein
MRFLSQSRRDPNYASSLLVGTRRQATPLRQIAPINPEVLGWLRRAAVRNSRFHPKRNRRFTNIAANCGSG